MFNNSSIVSFLSKKSSRRNHLSICDILDFREISVVVVVAGIEQLLPSVSLLTGPKVAPLVSNAAHTTTTKNGKLICVF